MKKWRFLLVVSLLLMLGALPWGVEQARAVPVLTPGVDYSFPHFAYSPAPAVTAGYLLGHYDDSLCQQRQLPAQRDLQRRGSRRGWDEKICRLTGRPGDRCASCRFRPRGKPPRTVYPHCDPSAAPAGVPWAATDDYYEIALVEYREQMHSDLPPVVGTWPNQTGGTKLRGYVQEVNGVAVGTPHYLGPLIIATKNRPVRIKFTNRLPARCSRVNSSSRWTPRSWGLGRGRLPLPAPLVIPPFRLARHTPRTGPPSISTAASRDGSAMERPTSGSLPPEKRPLTKKAPASKTSPTCRCRPAGRPLFIGPISRAAG